MSKLSLKVTRYMLWCWNVTQSDSHSSEGHILGAPMQVPSSVYMVNLMQTGLVVEEVNNMGLGWSQFLLFKERYFLSDILYCQHHHHTSWVYLSFAFEDIQSIKPFWNIKTGKKKLRKRDLTTELDLTTLILLCSCATLKTFSEASMSMVMMSVKGSLHHTRAISYSGRDTSQQGKPCLNA